LTPFQRVIDDARELAWWSHSNPSDRDIFLARKAAFTRLRESLSKAPIDCGAASEELRYLIAAAVRLAEHSGSNRWGVAYYERKAADDRLRGCLAVYDRSAGSEIATGSGKVSKRSTERHKRGGPGTGLLGPAGAL
jgi:hypothetical protein